MSSIHLPIRQLVEFLLRTGSIDSRFTGFDRALEGARIHRKLQKAAGEDYQAEVFLSAERQAEGLTFLLEGRADGIFTDGSGTTVIDEIKTTAVPYEAITEDMNPCHWAQGMVYGAIYCSRQSLPELNVQLTYIRSIRIRSSALCVTFPHRSWSSFCTNFFVSTPHGHGGSWTGRQGAARALPLCRFLLRSTAPGSGHWRGKSTVPAAPEGMPTTKAAAVCSVRHPPASARP